MAEVSLENALPLLAIEVVLIVGLVNHLVGCHHELLQESELLFALKASQVRKRFGWCSRHSLTLQIVHDKL